MKQAYWRKADHSGMLYPLIMTLSQQSNFRLSARLTEEVDPTLLLTALKETYQRFPMFKVELNNGFFRSCFVENFDEPVLWENDGVALGRIGANANNGYLIKVSYYKRNVYAEFFHGLTDGTGASKFFGYLLSAYAALAHSLSIDGYYPVQEGEDEDAYEKYYDEKAKTQGTLSSVGGTSAQIKGKFFHREGLGVISGQCDFSAIKAVSKEFGCSITALLGALVLQAALNTRANDQKKDPSVMIPVNLRKYFPSNTLLNFVCMENVKIPREVERNTGALSACIAERLSSALNTSHLHNALILASTVARNPFLRFTPAFVKRSLIVLGRSLVTNTKQTFILSNLGEFTLPPSVTPYVEDVEFTLNCNERTPLNCAVLSYCGKLRIVFSRHIVEKDVEVAFFRLLQTLGVDCAVRSNEREYKE